MTAFKAAVASRPDNNLATRSLLCIREAMSPAEALGKKFRRQL
jgi:hypothetical protein